MGHYLRACFLIGVSAVCLAVSTGCGRTIPDVGEGGITVSHIRASYSHEGRWLMEFHVRNSNTGAKRVKLFFGMREDDRGGNRETIVIQLQPSEEREFSVPISHSGFAEEEAHYEPTRTKTFFLEILSVNDADKM